MTYGEFQAGESPAATGSDKPFVLGVDDGRVDLPDSSFVRDAALTRDGMDLHLDGPHGHLVIEGYFSSAARPDLVAPDGAVLTPKLVDSFTTAAPEFAQNGSVNDATPVGAVSEVSGEATILHSDGTRETAQIGTKIYEGDIVETAKDAAVNLEFVDETTFAVSGDTRMAVDNYDYEAGSQSGTTDFSVLKGMFVFTSGLIGRSDPDDVHIETPVGSIGIRGTIIAGNVDNGEITVVEGAIVLHDNYGNEVTLAEQFETARFSSDSNTIDHMGTLSADDVSARYVGISDVAPGLFSTVQQSGAESSAVDPAAADENTTDAAPEAPPVQDPAADASGFGDSSGLIQPPVPGTDAQTENGANGSNANAAMMNTAVLGDMLAEALSMPQPQARTQTTMDRPAVNEPVLDPATLNTTTAAPVNHAPTAVARAPNSFFEESESQTWNYHFNKEFRDVDAGSTLHFQLSAQTIADLNAWTNDGAGSSPDVLNSAGGTGWSFNAANGELVLFLNSTFDAGQIAAGAFGNLGIEIRAIDQDGAASGWQTYQFHAYNAHSVVTALATNYNSDNQVVSVTNATTARTIVGDNNRFYFSDNNDSLLTLDNTGGGNTGSGNYINLGDGTNSATLEFDAFSNTIVGGANRDTMTLRTARVQSYGMDGDDTFVLDFGNGPNLLSELQTTAINTHIDGEHSNFRAGVALRALGMSVSGDLGGRGDTLQLKGSVNLDFRLIDDGKIKGIERLDMHTDTAAQNVTLNYNDVLSMTQDHKTLVITLGAGDTLNLSGSAFNTTNMTKALDNVAIDDGIQGTTENRSFDVFTDGNVTLVINNQGGTVTMDGTSVAI